MGTGVVETAGLRRGERRLYGTAEMAALPKLRVTLRAVVQGERSHSGTDRIFSLADRVAHRRGSNRCLTRSRRGDWTRNSRPRRSLRCRRGCGPGGPSSTRISSPSGGTTLDADPFTDDDHPRPIVDRVAVETALLGEYSHQTSGTSRPSSVNDAFVDRANRTVRTGVLRQSPSRRQLPGELM